MNTPKISSRFFPFVAILLIASLACSFGYNPQAGVYFQSGSEMQAPAAAQTNTLDTQASAQPTLCELDKIGTWSEISSSSRYRIEVGGHGIQLMDFYPLKGQKSVSYIVPAIAPLETPAIWFGYGSNWEGQLSECGNFDFVADATNYAGARLDSGHSGLVVDLRGGEFKVVANVANMSQQAIDALLNQHMAAMTHPR